MNTPKLDDIARKLGLSVSTVSRALSGKGRVSEKTRKLVRSAVEESNYTVNAMARSLRLQIFRVIGVVVPDIGNSFCASLIKGIQKTCHIHGFSTMVCNTDENIAEEEDALRMLMENQVSGLVIDSVGSYGALIEQYRRLNIPIVYVDNLPESGEFDVVAIDNRDAGYRLTRMLIERGYKNIGMITGPLNQSTGTLRYQGYCQAMRDAGLPVIKKWTPESEFRIESGYRCMRRIFESGLFPEAMIYANNYIAYGAIRAIRDEGYTIPKDIAVASFDTFDQTGLVEPVITSINQPAEQIGLRASELIIERIVEKKQRNAVCILLEPSVTTGNSL